MRRIAVLLLLVAVVLLGWLWLRPKAPSGAGTLYFLNWADYIPEELIQKFEAETGAKVVLDTFESPEAMLAKLKAGADQSSPWWWPPTTTSCRWPGTASSPPWTRGS